MPISRRLAEAHGGKLWLESEIGKGSSFYVEVPVQSSLLQPTLKDQAKHVR
jgi:signal transduction histidine kinase